MDEPAAGLTRNERQELLSIIQDVQAQARVMVVVVEHDMSFITALCSRAVVLSGGVIVYDGSSKDMAAEPEVSRVLLGT